MNTNNVAGGGKQTFTTPSLSRRRATVDQAITGEVNFEYPLATGTGGFANTSGCFTNGWCVIAAGNNLYSTVQCLDIQSGNPDPNGPYFFSKDSKGKQLPALGRMVGLNGLAVAPASDGRFYVVNVTNLAFAKRSLTPAPIEPPPTMSNLIVYGNLIIYLSKDAHLTAITVSSPDGKDVQYSTVWHVPLGITRPAEDAAVAVNGSRAVVTWGTHLLAFDLSANTPELLWGPKQSDDRLVELEVDNSTAYVSNPRGIAAYSLEPNAPPSPWNSLYHASNPGAPRCYNATVYFADDSGKFTALDARTGQRLWSIDLVGGAGNQTPIAIEDGIAYVTTKSTVNAIDLTDRTNLTYDGGIVEFVGVQNGIAFVVAGDEGKASLVGADLGLQVHGFACDSKLLADSVVSSTNSQPASPKFRTVVQLVDPDKNPRAFVSVKLWASDAVTIDAGDNVITLAGNEDGIAGASFLWLETDGSGTIYFASQAMDVSSPAIYLWASFMDTEEAMVLYPDQEAANDLATVQGGAFSTKTTFDGSPLLADGTDPDAAASALAGIMAGNGADAASTLRSTRAQLQQRASHQIAQRQLAATFEGRKRMQTVQAEDSYLAYPESTTNLLYQQFAGPTDRTFDATTVQPFRLTFNPKNGNFTFDSDAFVTPDATLGLSLKQFLKNVVHGVERVTEAICTKVGDVITHIVTTVENTYRIVVGALEDAVHVAVGVLKSIVRDVEHALEKAIEWLSFVFSWDAIKATKEDIYNRVVGGGPYPGLVSQLRSWERQYAGKAIKELQEFFDKASKHILAALGGVDAQYQDSTLQSQQQDDNDPKSVYNKNGANAYSPSSMITSKVNANIDNSEEQPSASAALESASSLVDLAEKVVNDAMAALGPTLNDLKLSFQKFIDSFRLLVTDPGKFIGTAFSALTAVLAEMAVLLLQAVAAIVSSLVGNIADMIEHAVTSLLVPIHVPVVSTIWNAIFRSHMSYLDLACWITAIPASIIDRATSSSLGATEAVSQLAIWNLVATIPAATFDAIVDGKGYAGGSGMAVLKQALAIVPLALSVPPDFLSSDNPLTVFYAFSTLPFITGAVSQAIGKFRTGTPFAKLWPQMATMIIVNAGASLALFAALAAFEYKDKQFIGPRHLKFCQNLFANVARVCKMGLFVGTGPARIGVAITDFCLPMTAAGCGVAASASLD